MIGVDTNVLVRYIIEDDKTQAVKAARLIEKYSGKAGSVFINNIVLCELIWVLERGYKYKKDHVVQLLKNILTTIEFSFEDHQILWVCTAEYEKSTADFSDILIGNLNKKSGCSHTYTFDSNASKLSEFCAVE
jgi:predicted nucleic-acid-binding protein